jgi:hypothetical protein
LALTGNPLQVVAALVDQAAVVLEVQAWVHQVWVEWELEELACRVWVAAKPIPLPVQKR